MTQAPGIDVFNQPVRDAWWTPGWTAQNQSYIPVPPNQFLEQGFPPGITYVTVSGNYFDLDANPLSGFFTFWPSSAITITVSGGTTTFPQRLAGQNMTFQGINQFGSGKVYLWNGQLSVNLLATDNANMTPPFFTYHVTENFFEGRQYDITVPSASTSPVDINSLIVPGSILLPGTSAPTTPDDTISQAAISTAFVPVNITAVSGGFSFNPTADIINFAFILNGSRQPVAADWHTASWTTATPPYMAQVLVGPSGGVNLSAGSYTIWAQIIAAPQILTFPAGYLIIF